jgi:hypothetical protein
VTYIRFVGLSKWGVLGSVESVGGLCVLQQPAGSRCDTASETQNRPSPTNETGLEMVDFITPGKDSRRIAHEMAEICGLHPDCAPRM